MRACVIAADMLNEGYQSRGGERGKQWKDNWKEKSVNANGP